jgi:hypothetical protein
MGTIPPLAGLAWNHPLARRVGPAGNRLTKVGRCWPVSGMRGRKRLGRNRVVFASANLVFDQVPLRQAFLSVQLESPSVRSIRSVKTNCRNPTAPPAPVATSLSSVCFSECPRAGRTSNRCWQAAWTAVPVPMGQPHAKGSTVRRRKRIFRQWAGWFSRTWGSECPALRYITNGSALIRPVDSQQDPQTGGGRSQRHTD